jgi:hypothetical protein
VAHAAPGESDNGSNNGQDHPSAAEGPGQKREVDMSEDTEERLAALETKIEGLYRIMAQAAEAVKDVHHRMDEEKGRSGASLIITMALVQALGRIAPEVLSGMIRHIEHVEGELAKNEGKGEGDAATAQELAECRVALKAVRQAAGSSGVA